MSCYLRTTSSFFFQLYAAPRYLHSFPTRRSSDLCRRDHERHPLEDRHVGDVLVELVRAFGRAVLAAKDRKSTRLNSSHSQISYAVFCLKKKSSTHKAPFSEFPRSV